MFLSEYLYYSKAEVIRQFFVDVCVLAFQYTVCSEVLINIKFCDRARGVALYQYENIL